MSSATVHAKPFEITRRSTPFLLLHLLPLAAFWLPFRSWMILVALFTYVVMLFGVTGGYHRYFSHRSYKAGRKMQFVLAWIAQLSAQKGVLWWSAHHRHHHAHSDHECDVHSPKRHGFLWSHMGWILDEQWEPTDLERVRDLARFPELVWISKWHLVPATVWVLSLIGIGVATGYPLALPLWGYFIPVVFAWHATFCINSLAHVFGSRIYPTKDTSRNSLFLAIITLGEGWHNNHHFYQRCAAQGWHWYQLDITYLILRSLQAVGLLSGVSGPPEQVRERTIDRQTLLDHDTAEANRAAGIYASPVPAVATPIPGALRAVPEEEIAELRRRVRELSGHAEGVIARVAAFEAEQTAGRTQENSEIEAVMQPIFEGRSAEILQSIRIVLDGATTLYEELGRSTDAQLSALRDEVVTILVWARTQCEGEGEATTA